jgi:hypothetical protein
MYFSKAARPLRQAGYRDKTIGVTSNVFDLFQNVPKCEKYRRNRRFDIQGHTR